MDPMDIQGDELWDALVAAGVIDVEEEVEDIVPLPVPSLPSGNFLPDGDYSSIGVDVDKTPEPQVETITFPREVSVYNDAVLDRDKQRLIRMTQVFAKFASMLALRNIQVDVTNINDYNTPNAPAWSDSDSITFNRQHIGKLDDPAVVTSLKGLSLHEIAHILLTPRDGTVLVKKVRADKLWQAFNALEDMRIEMFMTSRYANVKDWLTATIAEHLLKDEKNAKYQFPLVYGRKYLPLDVRKMSRDEYVSQADVPELEQLIDQYIVLNLSDPANYNTAHDIIKRYHEIVQGSHHQHHDGSGEGPDCITNSDGECAHKSADGWSVTHNPHGHDHRKNAEWKPSNGKALNKQQQDAIANRIKIDNGDGYDSDASAPDGDPSDAASTKGGNSGGKTYREALQDAVQDVYERRHEEIVDTIAQLNGDTKLNGKAIKPPSRDTWVQDLAVDSQAVSISRSFGTELQRLRGDHDPGWLRRTDAGRLNVGRYVTGADVDECFDEWQLGREDATDIEAVILLDVSSSMNWCMRNSYQSMWAIKRALDKINASTTVVTFGSDAEVLYSANERASITMRYTGDGGGTNPDNAVAYGYSVLANSNRAIKLFIAITDGYWYNADMSETKIRQLRNAGILTALAYVSEPTLDTSPIKIDSHGCEIATNITDPRDLFTLARKLVKTGIARNLA